MRESSLFVYPDFLTKAIVGVVGARSIYVYSYICPDLALEKLIFSYESERDYPRRVIAAALPVVEGNAGER